MKFHNYITLLDISKDTGAAPRKSNVEDFYQAHLIEQRSHADFYCLIATQLEWYRHVRPYYKVWPSIIEPLLRIPLDVSVDSIAIEPGRVFALRLPVGKELKGCCQKTRLDDVRSILIHTGYESGGKLQLVISAQGWVSGVNSMSDTGPMWFDCSDNRTFEDVIRHETRHWTEDEPDGIEKIIRLAVGVLLMANDPRIIMADVLSKDRRKYEETGDPKYIDKARKRGIVGWSIGEAYETCPHYRRPHFGIRHTGKGGKIPRIVPIKGAIVHNKKLTTVPTGYITPNGVEVEPQDRELT